MPDALAIVGMGYCGTEIARQWTAAGGEAVALDRFRRGVPEGIRPVKADLAEPLPEGVPARFGVITVGTQRDGLDAAGRAAEWLASCGVERAVYLSSTSVYGDHEGDAVDHRTATSPNTPMGERRVEAERRFADVCGHAAIEWMVLRLPGIYGPGRTFRERLLDGRYTHPEGVDRWSNRIHVEDVAGAVRTLLTHGSAGGVYVGSDGRPFRTSELLEWACRELGIPEPEPVPWSEIPERSKPFWLGSRRVDPSALTALGWRPVHTDVFRGHLAAWEQEDRQGGGELDHKEELV